MSPEWLWAGSIAGGIAAYLLAIDLLARWLNKKTSSAAGVEDDEDNEPDNADAGDADS